MSNTFQINYYNDSEAIQENKYYKIINKSYDINFIPPTNYKKYTKKYMFNEFDFDEYKYDIENYLYIHFYLNQSTNYYDLKTLIND